MFNSLREITIGWVEQQDKNMFFLKKGVQKNYWKTVMYIMTSFEIFLIFPNFLSHSGDREASRIYHVYY